MFFDSRHDPDWHKEEGNLRKEDQQEAHTYANHTSTQHTREKYGVFCSFLILLYSSYVKLESGSIYYGCAFSQDSVV